MKNALHLLVFIDERELAIMRNTRPDSPMYQDSLRKHRETAESIRNLLRTCQVDAEDRAAFDAHSLTAATTTSSFFEYYERGVGDIESSELHVSPSLYAWLVNRHLLKANIVVDCAIDGFAFGRLGSSGLSVVQLIPFHNQRCARCPHSAEQHGTDCESRINRCYGDEGCRCSGFVFSLENYLACLENQWHLENRFRAKS